MENLHQDLRRIFSEDRILDSMLMREIYGRDASYFNILPQAVVRPRTVAEIRELLALARRRKTGITFRTGGTSLSGQAVNSGIICELRTNWKRHDIRDNGKRIWFEPGLTVEQVNALLSPHHRHIGPDPASQCAAMMGGILANNSSGMEAGVRHNSYHTLHSIEFMLSNGHSYVSSSPSDRRRFDNEERHLAKGLEQIRREILGNPEMTAKIRRKYSIKNVTGYAMNSFLDFEEPIDIFAHLLIGSEGTLGYIVSAELDTLPLHSHYSSAMLYFKDVTSAASHASRLGESGALAVEMMDYASLRSYLGKRDDMAPGTTALLVDYGADSSEELADITGRLAPEFGKLKGLVRTDPFTHTVDERSALWKMRNGIFPCVAGVRQPGSSVILEDVVSPVGELDRLVEGVQNLFRKYNYQGAIFGHARDGNIHPLLTQPMDTVENTDAFRRFMDEFVEHVLSLEGSLKGEHGTGRAIAPFVEMEWGKEIYALMKRVKTLADPDNVLNPGVIINPDPECFMKPIKTLPEFGKDLGYERADMCIECGYCEHVCPTRESTLTPRQRLQARRVINAPGGHVLPKEYRFMGEESCCADGSCQMPCPMGINTGTVTDAIRAADISGLFRKTLTAGAGHFGAVESSIRGVLKAAVATEKVISPYPLIWASDFMHRVYSQVPHWSRHFPFPAKIHWKVTADPDFIYFPACVTRIFGGSTLGKDDLITVIMRLADRAGIRLSLPREMHGLCCSQIWMHKGDREGQLRIASETVEAFYRLSDRGRIPILCDTSSCTHTLLHEMDGALPSDVLAKYKALEIVDITDWLAHTILPRVRVSAPKGSILLHPTCASRIMGVDKVMKKVAEACAREVVVPLNCQCCGAAGDKGFIYPKIAEKATADERQEIGERTFDGYYSLARTCEISMNDTIKRPYEALAYLVDETTSAR